MDTRALPPPDYKMQLIIIGKLIILMTLDKKYEKNKIRTTQSVK